VSPLRPSGVSQLLVVARLPIHAAFASASATPGDSHATTTEASASARGVCSVMWGSASADRSIIASGSLPRTPSPAFGPGPRLFRASRSDSSEPPRPVPAPAGTPRPEEWTPPSRRTRRSSDQRTHPDGTRRRSSSEPRPPPPPRVRNPRLFGARAPPPGTRAPLRRGRPRRSSERWTHLVGLGDGALRSPALPCPRTRPPGSSESARPVRWDRPPALRGAVAHPQAGLGRTPPASAGIAVGVVTGFGRRSHTGQDGNDRKATVAVMRFRLLTRGTLRRVRNAPRELTPASWPPSGDPLRASTKRGEPSTGCGVQQTRNSHAEKTVEVVRNHEGGTRTGTWRRRSDGSFGSPEWTRVRYIGGRDPNPKRGGTNARRFQRSHERSDGEVKATRAAFPWLRPREADVRGIPRRPGPATA
jgi:hypothetical protein